MAWIIRCEDLKIAVSGKSEELQEVVIAIAHSLMLFHNKDITISTDSIDRVKYSNEIQNNRN